ncbi:MAG TPA: HEPN domain-containing protein [Candidatus Deferrimicrobium sp.]|nr:HEPN domain-containing protein [Candidatus Deferrimicrobium sp.]
MTTNFQKCKDWIEIAIADANTALDNYNSSNFYASFYFSQQSNEKLCKGLLMLFGAIVKKTHFPTQILNELIKNNKIPDQHIQNLLTTLIQQTLFLEREREVPRYGIEEQDRILKPQDLYSKQDALNALQATIKNIEIFQEIIIALSKESEFQTLNSKFQRFIEKVKNL